jgi:hypothetical protein
MTFKTLTRFIVTIDVFHNPLTDFTFGHSNISLRITVIV